MERKIGKVSEWRRGGEIERKSDGQGQIDRVKG